MVRQSHNGQALVEYVMLLLVVGGLGSIIFKIMPRMVVAMEKPLQRGFRQAYKYGDTRACGTDDADIPDCSGGAKYLPRSPTATESSDRMWARESD